MITVLWPDTRPHGEVCIRLYHYSKVNTIHFLLVGAISHPTETCDMEMNHQNHP